MTVAVTNSAGDKSDRKLKGLGPACLTIGSLTVLGGFLLQFVKHKMWKSKMQNENQSSKQTTYSTGDQTDQPGTSGTSNQSNNSRPIKIVARSSIEEEHEFDDIQEMKETWEDETDDFTEQTKGEEVTKIRTIEDELKEMELENKAYENPVMKHCETSETALPGSMANMNDSE